MLAGVVEYYPDHTQFGSEMSVHHACTCQPKLTGMYGNYKLTGACSYSMFVVLLCVLHTLSNQYS